MSFTITITLTQAIVVFASLLAMFSPPAVFGTATAILLDAPREVHRRLAWEIARNYALVLLLAIWLGRYLLQILGISPDALAATGGVALLYQGLPLMTRGVKLERARVEECGDRARAIGDAARWNQLAVVPLLFPVTIGGGTIAVVIAVGERYPTLSDQFVLSGIILAMVPVVACTFLAAGPLSGRLSTGAQDVLARFSGILLVALAMQLLVDGLAGLVAATSLGAAILRPVP